MLVTKILILIHISNAASAALFLRAGRKTKSESRATTTTLFLEQQSWLLLSLKLQIPLQFSNTSLDLRSKYDLRKPAGHYKSNNPTLTTDILLPTTSYATVDLISSQKLQCFRDCPFLFRWAFRLFAIFRLRFIVILSLNNPVFLLNLCISQNSY